MKNDGGGTDTRPPHFKPFRSIRNTPPPLVAGWLVGWVAGWAGLAGGWLAGWWLAGWLVGWLAGWLARAR